MNIYLTILRIFVVTIAVAVTALSVSTIVATNSLAFVLPMVTSWLVAIGTIFGVRQFQRQRSQLHDD